MADTKITALAAITTVDPAADVLPIVDVSDTSMAASGTTKKITSNQILGAGGTATLASATITGAATAASLTVTGSSIPTNGLYLPTTNTLEFAANSLAQYRIAPLGVFSWYDGAGGTRMTLNSTGLGVGVASLTNSEKLNAAGTIVSTGASLGSFGVNQGGFDYNTSTRQLRVFSGTADATGSYISFVTGVSGTINEKMRIDSSGNVGVGVTPRAWATGYRALNLGIYTALTDNQGGATYLTNNAYYDTVDSRWEAVTNNRALRYDQDTADGGHKWYSAPSVAANAALVWSTPMILDASGNLIWSPASTPPTLTTNGQLTVNATSNTNLRFSYRGSDGVTRVANITLA